MGDAMLGLVHPCKIYNILMVGAPVVYIGPEPSHVSEILDRLGDGHPWAAVSHGEVEMLVRRIQDLRAQKPVVHRESGSSHGDLCERRLVTPIDCRIGKRSGQTVRRQP